MTDTVPNPEQGNPPAAGASAPVNTATGTQSAASEGTAAAAAGNPAAPAQNAGTPATNPAAASTTTENAAGTANQAPAPSTTAPAPTATTPAPGTTTPAPANPAPDATAANPPNSAPAQNTGTTPTNTANATPAPAAGSAAAASEDSSEKGSLTLLITDWHGDPIPNLSLRLLDITNRKRGDPPISTPDHFPQIFSGKTNSKGKIADITNIPIGTVFELQVKKDKGEYKFAAIGNICSNSSQACLRSPKVRFEVGVYLHDDTPGSAEAKKQATIASHNQKPEEKPKFTGNPEKAPVVEKDKTALGNPKAIIKDGLANMLGIQSNSAPVANASDIEKVQKLVAYAEKQMSWALDEGITSNSYILQMFNKTFQEPAEDYASTSFGGQCNKYVKIALWVAGYNPSNLEKSAIGPSTSPAKDMGPQLISAGFTDVSASLPQVATRYIYPKKKDEKEDRVEIITVPNILYALPGDIIVYKQDYPIAPNAAGHIDIRTYHNFISDAEWGSGFPRAFGGPVGGSHRYIVTGVYRKYSDVMAEARVQAFLRIIREHEAKGFDDPYAALLYNPKGKTKAETHPTFSDFSTHPQGVTGKDLPAGAYQIKFKTWQEVVTRSTGWPADFTKENQDRIAVRKLQERNNGAKEKRRSALGYIREGNVDDAINKTSLFKEWSFLPGGGKGEQLSMPEMKALFEKYIKEYKK